MKAIILAAGKGERLGGIINDVPKSMVKVNGRLILEQNIGLLESCGITDI